MTYGTTSNRLTDIDTQSVTSDNNGNITAIHGMTLTHDTHNRLSSATVGTTTTNYAYNGFSERVTKQTGSNISHYLHAGPQLLAEYDDAGNVEREYVYLYDQLVVMLEHTGSGIAIYWIHNDHLGRPLALTDAAGDVVWRWLDADAFGNQASVDEDPDNDTVDLTFNLRFPGQYYDSETGFHYNWNRYYDPTTGRYITSDPIGLSGGLNTYLYAVANAIINVAPDGLLSKNKPDPDEEKPWKGAKFPLPDSSADQALRCMEKCMGIFNIMISGGAECTAEGSHQPGSTPGSKHCQNKAFDIPRYWHSTVDRKSLLCCARSCGIKYIQDEGSHYHFQTAKGKNGGSGILPSEDECKKECR